MMLCGEYAVMAEAIKITHYNNFIIRSKVKTFKSVLSLIKEKIKAWLSVAGQLLSLTGGPENRCHYQYHSNKCCTDLKKYIAFRGGILCLLINLISAGFLKIPHKIYVKNALNSSDCSYWSWMASNMLWVPPNSTREKWCFDGAQFR